MYDLANKFDNTFNVMKYTVQSMKEVGYTDKDIENYILEATSKDNNQLIDVSIDYINKCNIITRSYDKCIRVFDKYNDEIDFYNYTDLDDYYWNDNDDEIKDQYEGFDSCQHRINCDNELLDYSLCSYLDDDEIKF